MSKVRRAISVSVIALAIAFTGAAPVNALSPGEVFFSACKSKVGENKSFKCGSYQYTYAGGPFPSENIGVNCQWGKAYYYKRNSFTNPWDSDQWGWYTFCPEA